MKNKMMILGAVLVLCMLPWSYALADNSPMCEKRGAMDCCEKAFEKMDFEQKLYCKAKFMLMNASAVNLNEGQREQILDKKMQVRKSMILKNAEIEALALDIMAGLKKDKPDMETINAMIDKKYEMKKAKAKELAAAYVELCQIPTKEQKSKLKELWMMKA